MNTFEKIALTIVLVAMMILGSIIGTIWGNRLLAGEFPLYGLGVYAQTLLGILLGAWFFTLIWFRSE